MLHRKKRDPKREDAPENRVDKTEENPQEGTRKEEIQERAKYPGTSPTEDSTGENEDNYSFLQETIKSRPLSRERLFRQSARLALYGVILGIFACIGFFALKPWAEKLFQGDPETVTIPEDEEPSEEEAQKQESAAQDEEEKLDAMSYEEMMNSIYSIAGEAKKCIASVSTVSDSWTEETTGIETSVTGIITADNGQELLILAPDSVCGDVSKWTVTFADGSEYTASLKMRDENRHLAMFSVLQSKIPSSTWGALKVAVLGNSNLVRQGDMVIALGNTFNYADGISYGIISSDEYKETFYDGECDVIATDISAASEGSGVLFNLDGEVVGIALPSIWKEEGTNMANAYAISDLKSVIELLANGEPVPYIGVYGTTVTSRLKEEQGMPEGVYVIDVDPDSPAMAAGIQSGDIICEINGEKVTNLVTYQKAVLEIRTDQQISVRGMRLGADSYVEVDYTVTAGHK